MQVTTHVEILIGVLPARDCNGREVSRGFSRTCQHDHSLVFGTSLTGSRSIVFRATLRRLADI
jgi:hypothetical protein